MTAHVSIRVFFERHHDKIEYGAPTGCWLWSAGADRDGYGRIKVCGKTRSAHREAYEDKNGEGSAAGLVVRHRCDTPLSVNPDHLEAGTHADNVRDRDERGRQARGEVQGSAKLTETDVRTIRESYVRGSKTHGQPALARRFGVSPQLILYIIRRDVWSHVL